MTFPPDVEISTLSFDGRTLTFYDSDARGPQRVPLVLIHGTGGSAHHAFEALLPMLAFRHRVVTFDLLDPVEATTPPSLESYVRQLRAVIGHTAPCGHAHVVGYSLGAVIAALGTARNPPIAASLTLIAGWAQTDPQQRLRNELWSRLQAIDPIAAAQLTVLTTYAAEYLADLGDAGIAELVHAQATAPDRSAKMALNRVVDIADELGHITCPTLVIGCSADAMVPLRHSELLFGAIADGRLATVRAGHGVPRERPAELFTLIDRFVSHRDAVPAGTVIEADHA
jgi:pimeloyl-ACP methyl ester carboxylesterase